MQHRTRATALTAAGLLAATTLVTMTTTLTSTPAYAASATCHGKDATVVNTQSQAEAAGTDGDDVVLLAADFLDFEGGPGDDTVCVDPNIRGKNGQFIDGGPGDDWLAGGRYGDLISVGSGDDVVYGRGGPDRIHAAQFLHPGRPSGANRVYGGWGSDTFEGQLGDGADILEGGRGRDDLIHEEGDPALRIDIAAGTVRARSGGPADRVGSFEEFLGSPGNDVVLGSRKRDVYYSLGGSDTVHAYGGNDEVTVYRGRVYAGPGDDWVSDGDYDGAGATTTWLGPGDDVAYSWSNGGKVYAGKGGDKIRLGLVGRRAWMRLDGGPGRDRLTWSNCRAQLDNREGRFRCGWKVRSRVFGLEEFNAAVCSDYYPSCGDQVYADVLVGSRRNEVFRGGPGNDRIRGRDGRDVLDGARGHDRGWGGPGGDDCRRVEVRHSCG